MDNDYKVKIAWVFAVALTLSAISWAISWGYVNSWRTVTDSGYVEQQMSGSQSTIWIKPDQTR